MSVKIITWINEPSCYEFEDYERLIQDVIENPGCKTRRLVDVTPSMPVVLVLYKGTASDEELAEALLEAAED